MENSSKTILIIEDNIGDLRLIQEKLKSSGRDYKVASAASLAAGIQVLEQEPVDMVLLDLNLPDSQGLDTLNVLLGHAINLPIVVMTGLDDEALAIEAVKQGAQSYLVKGSVDAQAIGRVVRDSFERHKLRQDLITSELQTRSIINSSSDGLLVIDGDGIICFVNPAAEILFGLPTEEIIGKSYSFSIISNRTIEVEIKQPDDSQRIAESRATPFSWQGQPAQLISIRDITERKQGALIQEGINKISEAVEFSGNMDGLYVTIHKVLREFYQIGTLLIAGCSSANESSHYRIPGRQARHTVFNRDLISQHV